MKLGTATQLGIGVKDVNESFELYRRLGFHKIAEGAEPNPWVQISDGSLLILLNQDGKKYIGITYLSKDMDQKVAELEARGVHLLEVYQHNNAFLQGIFFSPEDIGITLVNFDPQHLYQPKGKTLPELQDGEFSDPANYPNPHIGIFGEFTHPVEDLETSMAFWKSIGFEEISINEEPYPWAIMRDGLNTIGLHQTKDFSFPAITYFAPDMEFKIEALQIKGIRNLKGFGQNGLRFKNAVLTTPEGEHIFLFSI